jgi:hypothetical protein
VIFAPTVDGDEFHDVLPTGDAVLVAGVSRFADASSIVLLRFDDRGLLDPAFGAGGTLRIGTQHAERAYLTRDAQGRILVAGDVVNGQRNANDVLVARVARDGRLDGAFGVGGVMTFDLGPPKAPPGCSRCPMASS